MPSSPHAWWDFGYAGILGCVFLEQIGVPIPAFPALLAAGALVASGELNLLGCLTVAVVAALLADIIWYGIGRVRGVKVLNLMCKVSWKPDTCVSKTKILFSQHGTKTLLFAKFVPGLSTLAPPLAGITEVPFLRFVLFDGAGTVIWALLPLVAGAYLLKSFLALQTQLYSLEGYLPWICGFLILTVLIWRFLNRNHYLRELRKGQRSGIGVEELKLLLDQGSDAVVVDVRDEINIKAKPVLLPNARWIPYSALAERMGELPLEKPIILYCDCPKDEASVGMADFLRAHGAKQARPLLGGLDAWLARGYETTELVPETESLAPATA